MPWIVAAEYLLLAALWGAAFIIMQVSAAAFGSMAMSALRMVTAAIVLLPVLLLQGQGHLLRKHLVAGLSLGMLNSAIPFALNGWSLQSLSTGFSAVLTATMPLFGAMVAWLWLGERPGPWRACGLVIGFLGVTYLSWTGMGSLGPAGGWAIGAALLAAVSYGTSSSVARRFLGQVPPLVVATGSQIGGAVGMAVPAALSWPAQMPGAQAWLAVLAGGVFCSALGYVLFFRLVEKTGPSLPLTVTFVAPLFAIAYGVVLLGEQVTLPMVVGGLVVLVGVMMATGLLPPRRLAGRGDDQPLVPPG